MSMTNTRMVLEALNGVHPMQLPESTIFHEVNLQAARALTLTEVRDALRELEAKDLAVGTRDELNGVTRWRITNLGRSELRV